MSDDKEKQLPPGSPNIQITLPGEWGSQKQEEIKVDSNQIGAATERRHLWNEDLQFPARLPDIWLQAGVWVCGSAFVASLLRSVPLVVELIAPLAVAVMVAIACILFAASRYSDLRLLIGYRCCLVICGICLGALL